MTTTRNGPLTPLLIAFLSFIIIGIPGGALGVAWIHIQGTFGLGLDALGLLLTAGTTGRLVTAFISGRLLTALGAGRYLLLGSLVASIGLLGYALAPVWPMLLAAGFIFGLGVGVIDAGLNTFIAPRYSASRMNWLHACFGLGLTFGPALITLIVVDLAQSWRWAYAVLSALHGGLTIAFVLTLPFWETRRDRSLSDTDDVQVPISATLRLTMMWLSLALFFFYGGAEIGTGQLLNNLLVEARAVEPRLAAFWVSLYWGSFTFGRMLIGIFVDRLGPRTLLRFSLLGTGIGAVLIWWNPVLEVSFAGILVMGVSLAAVFPTLVAVTPDRVGVDHTPNAIGFQIGVAGLGAALLVGLAGVLAERLGTESISGFLVVVTWLTSLLHEIILRRERNLRAQHVTSR
jgi:fucose permease